MPRMRMFAVLRVSDIILQDNPIMFDLRATGVSVTLQAPSSDDGRRITRPSCASSIANHLSSLYPFLHYWREIPMARKPLPPFYTHGIGSLPRPQVVRDLLAMRQEM